jgi:nitrogen fixation NifU-like protein
VSAIPEPRFDELFREVILDHYRNPRNHGSLQEGAQTFEGMNPVCGDEVAIDVRFADHERIDEIAFRGQGCSISQASASMLTEAVRGQPLDHAREVSRRFRAMMTAGAPPDPMLGDLEALEGVAKYPVRVKCALLAWNVLEQALDQTSSNGGPNG